jgi:2-polyprenyl-3-methyl-5-hydroxy-6-metoxy-1,4-benzoquinol methylase
MSRTYDVSVCEKYKPVYDETASLARKYLEPGDKALDFACGTGLLTLELSGSVKQILAIDISDNMIALAKKKATEKQIENVEFRNIDIFDPSLQIGSFDVIMAFNIFQFIKDENVLLERLSQLLSGKGVFIQATDCHSEYRSVMLLIMKILSRLKFLPYVRSWTICELENSLVKNHFDILETKLLYEKPVNYFIAAKKK